MKHKYFQPRNVISEIMAETQNTGMTMCDKRGPFTDILLDWDGVDCPDCLEVKANLINFFETIDTETAVELLR